MYSLIAKFSMVATFVAAVGTMSAANPSAVQRHKVPSAHPAKKAPAASNVPKQEKLVMAPGGVMVPRQAPTGHNPGFMDDGASKQGKAP